MRKLVTHRNIDDLLPIENADAIELAIVDGWQVVVKRDEFQVGDSCVFFEIDSWLPAHDLRFEFLFKTGVKVATDGKERVRLKTIKLRKQLSQGLALPWSEFPEFHDRLDLDDIDMAELIDVIKYERPEPKSADAKGNFPDCIPKTDEDRIQNVYKRLVRTHQEAQFYPTMKLDGSSCTIAFFGEKWSQYWKGEDVIEVDDNGEKIGELAVCSRNLQLKYEPDNHFHKASYKSNVQEMAIALGKLGYNVAIQGEVLGPGIQGNKENFTDYCMYVFNMYNIDNQSYYSVAEVIELCDDFDVPYVPVLALTSRPLQLELNEILEMSDGPSITAKLREGIVWKAYDNDVSFKSISNKWLLKTGD